MKKIPIIRIILVIILSLILLSMLFTTYWNSSSKEKQYIILEKEKQPIVSDVINNKVLQSHPTQGRILIQLTTPNLFNKPTIQFQRNGEWIEFQILKSF